ncbi:hypothetical protein HA466_0219190 [Hirschfeldia incana]|nr:hypothetical protein HA466_0219190 [Hirschfeldia incana]
MFSVSSSAHRLMLTVLCLVGLRSVRISSSSRFTIIFIAPVCALSGSRTVDVIKPFRVPFHRIPGKALTFDVVTSKTPRSMKHSSDLPSSPLVVFYACLLSHPLSHQGGDLLRQASPPRLRLISKHRRPAPTPTPSSDQPSLLLFRRPELLSTSTEQHRSSLRDGPICLCIGPGEPSQFHSVSHPSFKAHLLMG